MSEASRWRRDAFWCLLCLAVTDERLYIIATVVDPRYPGRLFCTVKFVCAKQWLLEECTTAAADAAVEDREAEEQTGPPTKRQRVDNTQPDLTPVETSFSRQLINDNRKKIEFLLPRIEYQKKNDFNIPSLFIHCSGVQVRWINFNLCLTKSNMSARWPDKRLATAKAVSRWTTKRLKLCLMQTRRPLLTWYEIPSYTHHLL